MANPICATTTAVKLSAKSPLASPGMPIRPAQVPMIATSQWKSCGFQGSRPKWMKFENPVERPGNAIQPTVIEKKARMISGTVMTFGCSCTSAWPRYLPAKVMKQQRPM